MNSELTIDGIPITVTRKNIRTLRLTVRPPHGRVSLSAPFIMDSETIRRFAASKIEWIKRYQTIIQRRPWIPPLQYTDGEGHIFLGRTYRLEVIERKGKPKVVRIDKSDVEKNNLDSSFRQETLAFGMANNIVKGNLPSEAENRIAMYVRPKTGKKKREALLDKWYRQQLKEIVPTFIAHYEPMMNVSVNSWGIKKMKTKWGTCNITKRRIWLNLELAKHPIEFVEEVVVHEMVHLLERKHNKRFKLLLGEYLTKSNGQLIMDSDG
ncbi:MAG: SprT-like domain-containing protein [Bacteroidota bacterium]